MNKLFQLFLLSVLLLSGISLAASMTVSGVSLISSNPQVTGMYSLIVEVSYSAPSGSSNCMAKVTSLPSGWAVRDNYDTNWKTLSACSGTTQFDIMPTSMVSNPQSQIVVEVKGTDSQGSQLTSGTGSPTQTITILYQPTVGLTTSVTSSSVTKGSTTTLNYELQNVGSASDTASLQGATLTISSTPSGAVTFSGGANQTTAGAGTIAAGSKITGALTLSISSSYLSTNSITFTIQARGTNTQSTDTESSSLTCSNCVTVTSGCSSSWSCGAWSTCSPSGTQTRTCTDLNNCSASRTESQFCTYTPIIILVPACATSCPTGQSQRVYPDCSCYTPTCTTSCPSGQTQNAYPDCSCVTPSNITVPGPEEAKNVTIIATPGGAIITIPSIAAEKRSSVSVAATITEVTGIMDISLTPRKYLAGVKIDIAKLDAKPATVAEPPKKVYKYLEIKAENATEADLLSATITFKIEKSWIGTKYNVSSVTLMRYTAGGWTTLDTTLVSQTATDYVFEATTPGFSYFAITAAELAAPAPLTPPTNVTPTTTPGQKPDYTWMLVVAAAIIIVVVAYWIYSRKPKYKVPEREKSKKK